MLAAMILAGYARIMAAEDPPSPPLHNRLQHLRAQRHLSQQQLATLAGISRSGISAIEQGRLVPSTAAALLLAQALRVRVEDVFVLPAAAVPRWAAPQPAPTTPYWQADVAGVALRHAIEPTLIGQLPHDGPDGEVPPPPTVVMASCDPAAGVLATLLQRQRSLRLLPLSRGSRSALQLLRDGHVHLAALHLGDNAAAVREQLGNGHALIDVARWREGLALAPGARPRSVRAAVRSCRRWVGREVGSGARQCLDELLQQFARPRPRLLHLAADHHGVASAVRSGLAEAGVCIELAAAQLGCGFLPVADKVLQLCTRAAWLDDPAVQAVLAVLRSREFRRQIDALPGYDARNAGEVQVLR